MSRDLNKADLDNYITGHWGEDQFRDQPEDDDDDTCWQCEGEGYLVNSCIEDCCCCLDPEEEHGTSECGICKGTGVLGGAA